MFDSRHMAGAAIGGALTDVWRAHKERQMIDAVEDTIGGLNARLAHSRKVAIAHSRNFSMMLALHLMEKEAGGSLPKEMFDVIRDAAYDMPQVEDQEEAVHRFVKTLLANPAVQQRIQDLRQSRERAEIALKALPGVQAQAEALKGRLQASEARLQAAERRHEKLLHDFLDFRAERVAYRDALRALDPSHPMLEDMTLRKRARNAAHQAYLFGERDESESAASSLWKDVDGSVSDTVREVVLEAASRRMQEIQASQDQAIGKARAEAAAAAAEVHMQALQAQQAQQASDAAQREVDLVEHAAMLYVVRSELERLHPEHPLVSNEVLASKICDVAWRTYRELLAAAQPAQPAQPAQEDLEGKAGQPTEDPQAEGPAGGETSNPWPATLTQAHNLFVANAAGSPVIRTINAMVGASGPYRHDPMTLPVDAGSDTEGDDPRGPDYGEHGLNPATSHDFDQADQAEREDPGSPSDPVADEAGLVHTADCADDARSEAAHACALVDHQGDQHSAVA